MSLQPIHIPSDIKELPHSASASHLIDLSNERIEAFMLSDDRVIENFVPCDFHLLDQALSWIEQNHLLTGRRFCEFGSGFGVAAMLAAARGMESVGIEIESSLVDQANRLSEELGLSSKFYCGSFVPHDISEIIEISRDVEHVDTSESEVYQEIGLELDDFDLFFAFPWPGEEHFFESVFAAGAAVNSLLLTYRGRNGMHLLRKT